jgi:tRNA(Arg) A34 adenosine deaminase TadA
MEEARGSLLSRSKKARGRPIGAVIVKDGEIVERWQNRALLTRSSVNAGAKMHQSDGSV